MNEGTPGKGIENPRGRGGHLRDVVWKEGPKPAFFDTRLLEDDVRRVENATTRSESLLEESRPAQTAAPDAKATVLCGAQRPPVDSRAWARVRAVCALADVAPALFSGFDSPLLSRVVNAAVRLGEPPQDASLDLRDFCHPPPRMPFLVDARAHRLALCDLEQTPSPAPETKGGTESPLRQTLEAFERALARWPQTPWGASLLRTLALSPQAFEAAARGAAVAVVGGFEGHACYVHEGHDDASGVRDVDAFFLGALEGPRPDARTLALWAHEAAHLAHGVALRARGQSPFHTSDVEKECVGLEGELLALCGMEREELARALTRGHTRALSAVAGWWQAAHDAGGPYVPAAWRVWNGLQAR